MSYIQQTKKVSLTWKSINAYAKDKILLNNCQGYCQSGQMLAIMGPSGAGKTTLLSLLSKRINQSLKIEGKILANNHQFNQKSFYSFGAFVYQNDLLQQTLTVRETLQFAAHLKISNPDEALATVNELLADFQLQKCQNTYVGGQTIKGISGGQKKRVCIAIQMVSKPSVIILDEPTSGLDSNKAGKVLGILKKFAKNGHTIIFTMHQPSYLQYSKLDRLILLNRGETVYQGSAKDIVSYMTSLNINVSKNATISDFFMLEISESKRINNKYQTPLNYQNYSHYISQKINYKINQINKTQQDLNFKDIYMASFLFSLWMLIKRDWTTYWRDIMKFGSMLLNTIMRFILIGVLYLNFIPERNIINIDPIKAFRAIQSLAFNCVASTIFISLYTVALSLPAQRQLFYKQTDSKKYSTLPYLLSKTLILYLSNVISCTVYCLSAYWLNDWTNQFDYWINFYAIILLLSFVGCGVGFFCAALFKEIDRVSALSNIVLIPMLILSGLFNKVSSMPNWSGWLQYLSPFRYGFQLIVQNQYRDQKFGAGGIYDYQSDLGYTLSYDNNFYVLFGIGMAFYIISYFLLKFNSDKMVA